MIDEETCLSISQLYRPGDHRFYLSPFNIVLYHLLHLLYVHGGTTYSAGGNVEHFRDLIHFFPGETLAPPTEQVVPPCMYDRARSLRF